MMKSIHAAVLATLFLVVPAQAAQRVVVISDLNGSYGSTDYGADVDRAMDAIIAMRPDLVISTGDMVAGQKRSLNDDTFRLMWAAFDTHVTDRLAMAGIPFAVTPGNHDASIYSGFERERSFYLTHWIEHPLSVDILPGGAYPFHYAFISGGVLFAGLDSTGTGPLPQAQMQWLENTLASHPEVHDSIVFGHVPLWPFTQGRETEIIGDPALEALFKRHGVDMVLSGHHQGYYPGFKDGTSYVGQACLGSGPRPLIGEAERSSQSFTVLDIADDGSISVEAIEGPDFTHIVDVTALPEQIVSALATIQRRDLAM